jgi:ubiquinone/menaquinone biosynthesis C-methylase UbiE
MAQSLTRAWWARLRGRLAPVPCPFSHAWILELPQRALVASPSRVVRAFGLRVGARAVEIGSGTGYYSAEAARRLREAGRLLCLDVQPDMVRATRRRARRAGQRNMDFVCGDAAELPLRAGSVSHVFLVTVLGELPDRRRAAAEIRRVLDTGGTLSVAEQLPDPDFVTKRSLRRLLAGAGFTELRTRGRLCYVSTWRRGARDANPVT